jgi:3,4-dihydroxy 2-butanone 4-phosphate synthase / GTP cyclohydrolase II
MSSNNGYKFDTIPEAIDDVRAGKAVIVVDDEDRENEGDLIMAGDKVTPEMINFFATYGRGLICVSLPEKAADRLRLNPMVEPDQNTALHGTKFTVSVDAVQDTTTGISAPDRAVTIRLLSDETSRAEDFARPGHIFPIKAMKGGVLTRAGHTEASSDLARLAGCYPVGVMCEIMDESGEMARVPRLAQMAREHNLKLITVRDLIEYRHQHERLIQKIATVDFPTQDGDFKLHVYHSDVDDHHHLAIVKGDVAGKKDVLVRVHSSCLTGDVFGSRRCDCGEQLHDALRRIEKEGCGVVLYMRQEGRGIGLVNKLKAYQLQQEKGMDTVDANVALGFKPDLRHYGVGAQILVDLGLSSIRLMTNNPKKIIGLKGYGLEVVDRVAIQECPTAENKRYLEAKRDRMGHLLTL